MPRFLSTDAPDPDTLPVPLAGFSIDAPAPHDSRDHSHRRAQLMYAVSGVLQIRVDNCHCILPPTLAAWIPSGLKHRAQASKPFAYRGLYLDPEAFPDLPQNLRILSVSPLLRELIVSAADWPLSQPDQRQQRLITVLLDELAAAPARPFVLPLPQDRRLLKLSETLLADPGQATGLEQLAAYAGASARTVNRLFQHETGMNFSTWRQQLKVISASHWLAEGESVGRVAYRLGYEQESAFIAMFRKIVGVTPGQLQRQLTSAPAGRSY